MRQSSEALAAVVIVITIVVYGFALISGITNPQPETVAASLTGSGLQTEASVQSGEQLSSRISQNTSQNEIELSNKTNTVAEASTASPNQASAQSSRPIEGVNASAATQTTSASPGQNAPLLAQTDNTSSGQQPSSLASAQTTNTPISSTPASAEDESAQNAPAVIASINNQYANTAAVLAADAGEKFALEQKAREPVFKYVQIDELNVRSGPGSDNEKLAELGKGTRIQVLQQANDKWLEVITPDKQKGYVYAEYTADTKPPVYKYVSVDKVNLRDGAGSDTEKLGTLYQGTRIQVIEVLDKWINIITSDDVKGYVYAEYVSDKAPVVYKYVNSTTLNLRKGPDAETKKLATLKAGDKVQFLETKGEWSRIKTSGDVEGYVKTKYVVNSQKLVSRAEIPPQPHNSDLATKVLEYAQKFVGVKYVYGGKSPKGFDCSGFTQYVFEHFDIEVPRSAAEYYGVGTKVSRSDIKPGDLLLLDRYWDNELGHVGIYIGDDKFIHASSRKAKIVIASLSDYTKYSGTLLGIRRVIK